METVRGVSPYESLWASCYYRHDNVCDTDAALESVPRADGLYQNLAHRKIPKAEITGESAGEAA